MDKLRDKASDKLRRTLTGSAINALAALLMIGAISFGATVIRPMTADRDATTASSEDDGGTTAGNLEEPADSDGTAPVARGGSGYYDGDKPSEPDKEYPDWKPSNEEEPKDEPAEEPKEEPKDEPKDEPKPDPAPSGAMSLQANFNADKGKIVVKWTAFGGDFEKYKLVRSWDATVTWPEGEGDTLVGVVGPDSDTYFVDYDAPCNDELHYRVFAVRHGEEGYVVLGSSNVDGALRECGEEPPAEPKAMGFDLLQVEGGVKLAWEQCSSEAFVVYKVVRSATNASPMYPLNDGTELIGVIDNPGTTMFFDSNVEPGQTWTYRVLSMGSNGDGWFVLGLTDAKTITVE
jgi:hypothetical protein